MSKRRCRLPKKLLLQQFLQNQLIKINWIKLIIHFVECASKMQIPPSYQEKNEWSSYLWLDTNQVFQVLNFDKPLSDELLKIKQWMMKQIKENSPSKFGLVF